MPQIGTSGSMSGEWKRGDWPTASSYRATPRLYSADAVEKGVESYVER
jgi:hypothetical protein